MSYNIREIDLSTAHTRQFLDLGIFATIIRVVSLPTGTEAEISFGGGPMLPITHVGQKFLTPCQGGRRKGFNQLTYTNAEQSGTLKLFVSDDESDVDFSAASTESLSREIVLATIIPRDIAAALSTHDPAKDTNDPLTALTSGDGTAHIAYDGVNEIIGARFQVPAGGTDYSHAGGQLQQYALPLAQLLNTQGLTNHRGRPWYVELATSIYSTFSGSSNIYRGIGFGEINYTVAGWNKPFVGIEDGRGGVWRLFARDSGGVILSEDLTGYATDEIQAVKIRIGQDGTGPYLEAHMNGALAHRESLPLTSDLGDLGSYNLNPFVGCVAALAAESVEIWAMLDGAMTLKLVFPEG